MRNHKVIPGYLHGRLIDELIGHFTMLSALHEIEVQTEKERHTEIEPVVTVLE